MVCSRFSASPLCARGFWGMGPSATCGSSKASSSDRMPPPSIRSPRLDHIEPFLRFRSAQWNQTPSEGTKQNMNFHIVIVIAICPSARTS